jgi:formylglycine-generating enzyme required for sulfatase activity
MWSDSYGCKIQRSGSSGSNTYSVADDWANRPVNHVSWYDCIRFANWLQNGQGITGSGDTESGTYTISGSGPNWTVAIPSAATRATWTPATAHWVLPSEDEWYKASYYDPTLNGGAGGYWDYPTKSNTAPSNVGSDGYSDPGNHANYENSGYTLGSPYYRTKVGEFENSASAYGTFDQGGNVWEWNEADFFRDGSSRVWRGGSFYHDSSLLSSARARDGDVPSVEHGSIGFRVASVPEPGSLAMLLGLALTAVLYYWCKHA